MDVTARHLIFLPVRNGGDYVRLAIDSVRAQTVHDWHLVVLENGSRDGTEAVCRGFDDARISVHPAAGDLGIVENWQRALALLAQRAVAGEFVSFIGHDDLFYPGYLQEIETLAAAHPDASLYQTALDLIDQYGRAIRPGKPLPATETAADFLAARAWGLRDSFGTGYTARVRDYITVGGIPEMPQLLFSDDLLFARLAALRYKAAGVTACCAYRLHRGSASATVTRARFNALLVALDRFLHTVESEFPAYWRSDTGRAAVACLIAREARIFGSPWLNWALDEASRAAVARFAVLYQRFAPTIDGNPWLGSNAVATRLYPLLRRAFLAFAFIRERLRM